VRCPGHDDRGPSCSITAERGGVRVHCFAGCAHVQGDVFKLIAAVKGLDCKAQFAEVLQFGAELAGVALEGSTRRSSSARASSSPGAAAGPSGQRGRETARAEEGPSEEQRALARVGPILLELCSLEAPSGAEGRAYLARRGVLEEAIGDSWGVLPPLKDRPALIASLIERAGGVEAVAASGLVRRGRDGALSFKHTGHPHEADDLPLLIPYRGPDGSLMALERRRIDVGGAPPGVIRYVHHGARVAIGGAIDVSSSPASTPIAYTEGAVDRLALRVLARRAGRALVVVALAGVDAWHERAAELSKGRRALVATDNDPPDERTGGPGPGDRAALKWGQALIDAGALDVQRLRPEGAKDWAELTEQLAGVDEAADLWIIEPIEGLKKPPPLIEWLAAGELAAELAPTPWVIKGLQICPGRPAMLAAYGSSGKTLAAQSMLLSLSLGLPIWRNTVDFRIGRAFRVAHLDYEQGKHATIKRYQRLALALDVDINEAARRLGLSIYPTLNLVRDDAIDAFSRALEGVDLCVIDSLRGSTPGIDENDSKIRLYVDALPRVSERIGVSFVVIHHAGKPPTNASANEGSEARGGRGAAHAIRGSSAIFDACGSIFVMSNRKGGKYVEHVKSAAEADSGLIEPFYLVIEDVAIGSNPRAGVRLVYKTIQEVDPPRVKKKNGGRVEEVKRVLAFLQANPGIGRREFVSHAKELELSQGAAWGVVEGLERMGNVRREEGKGKAIKLFAVSSDIVGPSADGAEDDD
jgi:hypothetical protein